MVYGPTCSNRSHVTVHIKTMVYARLQKLVATVFKKLSSCGATNLEMVIIS